MGSGGKFNLFTHSFGSPCYVVGFGFKMIYMNAFLGGVWMVWAVFTYGREDNAGWDCLTVTLI